MILSATLLPIKAPVTSTVFLNISVLDSLTLSRRFGSYLLLTFLPIFLAKHKDP